MDNFMIEIKDVYKAYKDNILFEKANLNIKKGEICGIIGRNGSGKSVLLKILGGLIQVDKGIVIVNGENVGPDNFPRDIGVILDCTGFLGGYTGFENLKMIAAIRKVISVGDIKRVMQFVGLDPNSRVKVGKYSLGMKQRLAFAQAIMESPSLLILDEPMNGIDVESQKELRMVLKDMNQREGVTIVITSHNEEDIEQLCHTVYRICDKKLQLIED